MLLQVSNIILIIGGDNDIVNITPKEYKDLEKNADKIQSDPFLYESCQTPEKLC